jgi:hypothetical protein
MVSEMEHVNGQAVKTMCTSYSMARQKVSLQ